MLPRIPDRALPVRAVAAGLLLLAPGVGPPRARGEEPPAGTPPPAPPARAAVLEHALEVTLDPDAGRLAATDAMTVDRRGAADLVFDLSDRLALETVVVGDAPREAVGREPAAPAPGMARYRVPLGEGKGRVTVRVAYSGVLREEARKEGGAGFVIGDRTRGTISPEGVFLSESTGWVPSDGGVATYGVVVKDLPPGWQAVTQGGAAGIHHVRPEHYFTESPPADGLWLQAGKWKHEHRETKSGVRVGTYLSEANAPHAKLLLDAAEADLAKYEALLGPYPHRKFDIVENFFTSGYGMPGATLLGGDVIARMAQAASHGGGRIPAGYLDHEIVHGWWGNGVLVDYAAGNWCEALTTYCTNYLRKEWESPEAAAEHRRAVRAKFAARVRPDRDYPLRRFTGKTEDFENDIGYGKGSLLFHAVRREIGDDAFFGALRKVAAERAGTRASWDDLRRTFEAGSRRNLEALFGAFLDLPGAPVASLAGFAAAPDGDGWRVTGEVTVRGPAWPLAAPLVVETARGRVEASVDLASGRRTVSLRTDAMPTRVLLDPDSHCWRGFVPGEEPATLDATLAARPCAVVLPADAAAAAPFAPLVAALEGAPGVAVAPAPAPGAGGSILLLGDAGRALDDPACPVRLVEGGLVAGGQTFRGDDLAVLASFRAAGEALGPGRPVTLYTGLSPGALGAARRVFYYGADGVVVFRAGRPVLRLPPEGDASSRAALLGEGLLPGAGAARIEAGLAESRPGGAAHGRLAGTKEGAAYAALLARRLREEDGHEVVLQRFSVDLGAAWSGEPLLFLGDAPYDPPGVPFCFSGSSSEPVAVKDAAVVRVTAETTAAEALASIRGAADGRAPAVLVLGPGEPPAALADYLLHAGALPEAERRRLEGRAAAGGSGSPDLFVAGKRARLLAAGERLDVPVVYLGQRPERSALPTRIDASRLPREETDGVNVLVVLPGTDPALAGEPILLGCHHDGLGEGFAGADDDLSGVLALREAGRILQGRPDLLRRPVLLAFFDAEEWGLRGSRAFAAAPPPGVRRPVAALTLDTVGDRASREVFTVGRSVYPALASVAERCLAGAGLAATGRDIDRFAFAHGSDHYALHEAGIPAVDWFSGDYARMHTRGDTADRVDPGKVAALARAAAAFAVELSRGGLPR